MLEASIDRGRDTASSPPVLMEELWREIAEYCASDTPALLRLGQVSKTVRGATLKSRNVWKLACWHRWRGKWGFSHRWKTAQSEYQNSVKATDGDCGLWWRDRYFWQEEDAKRSGILPEELTRIRFDFRFWLSQVWVFNNLSTGLTWSDSLNFRYIHQSVGKEEQDDGGVRQRQLRRGFVRGHPIGRDDLEWFLSGNGESLQWGLPPHMWPKGTVHRLETWGWELRNPNVCMRAIEMIEEEEDHSTPNAQRSNGAEEYPLYRGGDPSDCGLWRDHLSAIQRVEVSFGIDTGGGEERAYLDAPLVFWDYELNRRRFPPRDKSLLNLLAQKSRN